MYFSMGVHGLSVFTLALFFSSVIIPDTEAGNQIALHSVSVNNDNATLILTVTYAADYQPEISWIFPTLRRGAGMVNLDFEQTDVFNQGQGQTTARIQHDVALTQNSKLFLRLLILRNPDCEVNVQLQTFHDLLSRDSSTTTVTFDHLALTLDADGTVLDPGQDLVLKRFRTRVTATLSSPQLPNFEVNVPWISHARFDYAPGDFAGLENDYGHRDESIFQYERRWVGSNTTKQLHITLKRSRFSTGILELYMLSLKHLNPSEAIVPRVQLKQNIYLLQSEGEEAVRRNTVYIRNKHLHYLSEFDMPVNLHVPEFSFTVVGNPLPRVSLYRACSEMSENEVEVFETRVNSRYEVTSFFRFRNASEALAGSYNVVARSGSMEAREIMSVGVV